MASETNITVSYEEVAGSPTSETATLKDGFQAVKILRCDWGQRRTLTAQLLGMVNVFNPALPARLDDAGLVRVKSVSSTPEGALVRSFNAGGSGQVLENQYEKALLTVNFASYNGASDVLYEESLEPSFELITVPHFGLYWDASKQYPLAPTEAPIGTLRKLDWTITKYNVTQVPGTATSLMGFVNDNAVVSKTLGLNFGKETLLYHGGVPSRAVTLAGATAWTLTDRFTAQAISWNKFFRKMDPGNGANNTSTFGLWQDVFDGAGNTWKFFPLGNFLAIV